MVCIKDRAIDAYMQPFFVQHRNQAIRGLQDEVNREGSELGKHPEDYDLYLLGEWDEQTGKTIPCDPLLISRAQDLVNR